MFSAKIKGVVIISEGPTFSTDMDAIKKWVRPAPCKSPAACFSHIPKLNCLSGLTLCCGNVISVLQIHKNICGNVVITWLRSTCISKPDCVITVLSDNCDVAREKWQWNWDLKIEELFWFPPRPQLCLHKSRLSSDATGVPIPWEKKSVVVKHMSVPWPGGWG